MLARLKNQPKNNADIGAVCAACRVRGCDDGIGRDILTKNSNSITFCNGLAGSRPKPTKADPYALSPKKNHVIYAVQALTLFPNL